MAQTKKRVEPQVEAEFEVIEKVIPTSNECSCKEKRDIMCVKHGG
jgi:hypothetical protein